MATSHLVLQHTEPESQSVQENRISLSFLPFVIMALPQTVINYSLTSTWFQPQVKSDLHPTIYYFAFLRKVSLWRRQTKNFKLSFVARKYVRATRSTHFRHAFLTAHKPEIKFFNIKFEPVRYGNAAVCVTSAERRA